MRLAGVQDVNAFASGRLGAQLQAPELRSPRGRFFGGPISLPVAGIAPSTAIAASRVLLQTEEVAKQGSLANVIAGPGVIA